MNIKITKKEFETTFIWDNIIGVFKMGSHLYGLNDVNSDTDYLVITSPFKSSPFINHHQLQYTDKDLNVDYNIIDIDSFIRNLCTGDSIVNYEILYSPELINNKNLSFLYNYRKHFKTYNIVKSFLGFVDRDIRHFNKKTQFDALSAMIHILRGFLSAKMIIEDRFSLVDIKKEFWKLKNIDSIFAVPEFRNNLPSLREEIKEYRQSVLNPLFESKEIPRFLNPEIQFEIHSQVDKLKNTLTTKEITLPDSILKKIFDTNENIELKY